MLHDFDERLVLDDAKKQHVIYDEHIVRYRFAAGLARGKKILDIACGSGYGTNILSEAGAESAIGVDADEDVVAKARSEYKRGNLEFCLGDAQNLTYEDKSFDMVSSFETIEHLQDVKSYLGEISRLVKDKGLALISTPNREVSKEENPFHLKEYNYDEFLVLLRGYFEYVEILEQGNGITSYIAPRLFNKNGECVTMYITNKPEPVYFLALCSHSPIDIESIVLPVASINPAALRNLYDNPGMKAVNNLYKLLIRIPGMKRLLSFARKRID